MPLGWERINVRQTTPNKHIVFIKPLPGLDETTSKDFLERIAAQCLPIMSKHHLAVVSLEEYEYNTEFLGRNFNNGEVIQLVLKSGSGNWLPFNFVQMVMMHELAHNKQMNHSKTFWAVRNEFAVEMKVLWGKGYTGDGLWGRGVLLENGLFEHDLDEDEPIPEHTCGGTFKSKGGNKRKAKPKITYKEQKERRIRKKFGPNGVALGADEETKVKLEKGRKPAGKPRVAGSARGRELRAAAALARFEVKQEEPGIKDEELVTDSEAESGIEDDVKIKVEPTDAVDMNGRRLLDRNGRGMVKICEDEANDDDDAKNELLDLHIVPRHSQKYSSSQRSSSTKDLSGKSSRKATNFGLLNSWPLKTEESSTAYIQLPLATTSANENQLKDQSALPSTGLSCTRKPLGNHPIKDSLTMESCPVCSVVNDKLALTCMVCANVLKPDFVPDSWRCKSSSCVKYVNAGDVGLCGVCGTRREVLC